MKSSAKGDDVGLAGYGGYCVQDEETYNRVTLFLPNRLLQTLREEHLAAELALKVKEAEDLQPAKRIDEPRVAPSYKPRSTLSGSELDLDQETKELEEAAGAADGAARNGDLVAVHDVLEPLKLIKDLKARTPDREIHKRYELLYRELKPKGHLRALARPQPGLQVLEHMRKAFPHFLAVLDLVRDQFALSELTGKPFVLPPILLGGVPGIGKTRFTQELAKTLRTVMRRLPFDNGQSGASLLGSDRNWANTAYGSVFEMVVLGEYANPVILLDEIDKAGTRREGHALASLHTLLEPVTAHHARDISVDFEFDASWVSWIATANDLTRIPESLRSRFHTFWIEQPTGAQALQMAEVVAQEVHREMNVAGFKPPARQLVHYIAHLNAREQVQALKRAYAAAKADGRHQVVLVDLPEQVRREAKEFAGEGIPPAGLLH